MSSQIQTLDMRNGHLGNESVNRAQCKEECMEISLVSMALETSRRSATNFSLTAHVKSDVHIEAPLVEKDSQPASHNPKSNKEVDTFRKS